MAQIMFLVSDELKRKFVEKCQNEGRSLTEVLTGYVKKECEDVGLVAAKRPVLTCSQCEKTWTPRRGGNTPAICPFCKSYKWNGSAPIKKGGYDHKCKRCSFAWNSRLKAPKICPACKSYQWREVSQRRLYAEFEPLIRIDGGVTEIVRQLHALGQLKATEESVLALIHGKTPLTEHHIELFKRLK